MQLMVMSRAKNYKKILTLAGLSIHLKILILSLRDSHSLQSRQISKFLHLTLSPLLDQSLISVKFRPKKARSFFSPAINSIMTVCSITDRSNVTADGSCQLSLPTMQVGIGEPIIASRVSVFQARVLFLPDL